MSEQLYHAIGFRDALAQICAVARNVGDHEAIQQAAAELLKFEPEHCHAQNLLQRDIENDS